MTDQYLMVYVTVLNSDEAKAIACEILKVKAAACVNIVNDITSLFWWKEQIDQSQEYLLICKTVQSKFDLLKTTVEQNHSYDVPEIIGVPIVVGNESYLKWIDDSVK